MDSKLKHLEFIQETIKRMAGNSFLLRGWSITIIIGIFTVASNSYKSIYILIVLFTTITFWALDSYYLFQERRFRCLYDEVRKKEINAIDFSMVPITNHCNKCTWFSSVKSPVFMAFYALITLILILILITTYINFNLSISFK